MATITVTSIGILTPETLANWPFGGVVSITAQTVVVFNAATHDSTSYTGVYSGSFATTISGDITGTVTGFSYGYKTSPFLTITGLSVSAAQLFAMVGSHNVTGLTDLLFGGNDVINAQLFLSNYGPGQVVNGLGGNDLINGSNGTDQLTGGVGDDTVHAGLSQDTVVGGGGQDVLYGDAGNDVLSGETGRDLLSGGWDSDTLTGGAGADQIYGGLGADLFVWRAARDSTEAKAGRDVVQDFSSADGDKLDLTGIDAKAGVKGNQAFVLVDAFSHHAGELHVQPTATGSLLFGDTDGDGTADFSIALFGTASFSLTDFLL